MTALVLNPNKLCVFFGIFAFGLRAKMTSIQAWNFQRVRSAKEANTNTDIFTTTNSPIPYQIVSPSSRRQVFLSIPTTLLASASLVFACPTSPALARNMPVSNGADTSKVGTVSALLPIISLRTDLESLRQTLQEQHRKKFDGTSDPITKTKSSIFFSESEGNIGSSNKSSTIPTLEKDFKRVFDAYSDQVSYKQKFLDQNAFLVYYTNGYDGPGRDSLEKDPVNERQTLQFGARNEAWIGWDDFLAEWEFYSSARRSNSNDNIDDSFLDMMKYLSNTIQAVDTYLRLSPPQDLEAVQQGNS